MHFFIFAFFLERACFIYFLHRHPPKQKQPSRTPHHHHQQPFPVVLPEAQWMQLCFTEGPGVQDGFSAFAHHPVLITLHVESKVPVSCAGLKPGCM